MEYERSLAYLYPEVAKEWDYEKNGEVTPKSIAGRSNKKVWWICENSHSWSATIHNRTRPNSTGCPFCSGSLPIPGETDLATVNPELAKEWDYEKNGDLTPQMFLPLSSKKVWWKCKEGHSWEAQIANRNAKKVKTGCPYCSGQKVLEGETDLLTVYPELADEWDYDKNGELLPSQIYCRSNKRVWWRCERGHSWESVVAYRVTGKRNGGGGCPFCSGRLPIPGETDLASVYPELIKEWDYVKNGELTPDKVTAKSGRRVWWKCEKGHTWKTSVANRIYKDKKYGCPFCSGRLPIPGETDLATVNPELAKEWDYEKNGELTPEKITAKSGRLVWWKCEKGHSWRNSPCNRNKNDQRENCPFCNGKYAIPGETDLATLYPYLMEEWDYEKNNRINPCETKPMSNKKAWWVCRNGHSWKACISSRTMGCGCPICNAR